MKTEYLESACDLERIADSLWVLVFSLKCVLVLLSSDVLGFSASESTSYFLPPVGWGGQGN